MEVKNKKVYIVEDSNIISDLLERFISNTEGYQAKAFCSGESMIADLENGMPDIILLDYYLDPAKKGLMNGEQVLQKLQILGYEIPVIMLTGLQDVIKLERLKYFNVKHILNKDRDDIFDKVVQTIKKIE